MICRKCGREVPEGPFCLQCGAAQTVEKKRTRRGNGEGHVWKRGKSWYAQVTLYTRAEQRPDGSLRLVQKRRTRGGFATKREALAALETLRGPQVRNCPTLLQYWENYERNKLPKLSRDRQSAARKARERLDSLMGCRPDVLTILDLQNCVDENARTYYTAKDMKTLLSHLWKLALADQFVSVDLPAFISLPELEEKEGEPFTELEVGALWKAYSDGVDLSGHILLMIYSGMMPGELLNCRLDQIDLEACEIRGCGLKTSHRKAIPIVFPEFLRPVVASLTETAHGTKLLHINRDNFYKRYYEALETAGVRRLPPYSCRHTTGTEAARANLAAPIVQNIMRHARITTTQRYVHLGAQDAHDGIHRLKSSG